MKKIKLSIFVSIVLIAVIPSAYSAAPLARTQPGFYRMMLGEFEITVLNDGVIPYETSTLLPDATPEQIKDGLYAAGLTDPFGLSYNAYLINTGEKLILIDTGTGGKLDDSPFFRGAGRLMMNLRAAGYRPEQIDAILITHQGPDHIGGLTVGSKRAFPNAIVYAPNREFAIYLDSEKRAALLAQAENKEETAKSIKFIRDLFEPYIKAGKYRGFDEDIELVPGIRALATYGHMPGHTSYVVESKGQRLIVMGDLVLMGALQFAKPELGGGFNADPKAAAEQRLRVFKIATEHNDWVAGSHLSFPSIGHIRFSDGRYLWAPANYTIP